MCLKDNHDHFYSNPGGKRQYSTPWLEILWDQFVSENSNSRGSAQTQHTIHDLSNLQKGSPPSAFLLLSAARLWELAFWTDHTIGRNLSEPLPILRSREENPEFPTRQRELSRSCSAWWHSRLKTDSQAKIGSLVEESCDLMRIIRRRFFSCPFDCVLELNSWTGFGWLEHDKYEGLDNPWTRNEVEWDGVDEISWKNQGARKKEHVPRDRNVKHHAGWHHCSSKDASTSKLLLLPTFQI